MVAKLQRTRQTIRPTPDPLPVPLSGGEAATALIEQLRMQLRVQAAVIGAQQAALERSESLVEPALRAAGMGMWVCSLPDDRLEWSEGVYELFGLDRGSVPTRADTLALYTAPSRRSLTVLRGRALADGGGFSLDAEIAPPNLARRWIRITATIERRNGLPVRLFGLKQDITQERRLLEHMRRQAETDPLTGLANRARFEARLREPVGTLLLIDLDGFKAINDSFGHPAGDLCLREAARRLGLACRRADLVARIGGDEFAVVLDAALDAKAAASCAARIVAALCRPVGHEGQSYRLGASVGVAVAGAGASDLFAQADAALYAAKAAGRRTFRLAGVPA